MDYARADTYNMDTRKLQHPVVKERTERGREMQSSQRPTDFTGNKGATDRQSRGSLFHEGYVDGKLYLVPDSNLEAMKDIINLKMRRQENTKYLNLDPQKEAATLQRYEQKRDGLLKKLDLLNLELPVEEKVEEEEAEEKDVEEEEVEEEEQAVEEDLLEVEEEESEEEEEEVKGNDEEEIQHESEEEIDTIFPGQYYNPHVKRFLISGHFRTNRKPIYIIQQYSGPSVFSTKDPQFYSHKSEKDTDIFISGEFYKETILEEDNNQEPKRLKTKPRKIKIDTSSRIYEKEFSDTFVGDDVDVTLTGRFIKHTLSALCTPLLTISLKKGTANTVKDWLENRSKSAAPVYVSRPIVENIFEKEKKKQRDISDIQEVSPKIRKKPHKKTLSKLSGSERKKAGYNFQLGNNRSVLTSPLTRRNKRDEKLALIKSRMRGSRNDERAVLDTSHVKSYEKRLNKKYHKGGKGDTTAEKGSRKESPTRKPSKLSAEEGITKCERRVKTPFDQQRKIEMHQDRRKDKKKQEKKAPSTANKILDSLLFFNI